MQRWEAMQKEVDELHELHTKLFGWAGGEIDKTRYHIIEQPDIADYAGWKEKKETLEKVISFYERLREFKGEFVRSRTNYNIILFFYPEKYRIEFGIGYAYGRLIRKGLEVCVTDAEDVKEAKREKYDKLSVKELIDEFLKVVREELKKTEEHIAWLEEEVRE